MKRRLFFTLIVLFTFLASECFAVIIKWYKFPELVNKSTLIVTGRIVIKKQQNILFVDNFIKGKAQDELVIKSVSLGMIPVAHFEEGERVLLFLEQPDNNGIVQLLGASDQSKWPRNKESGGYESILSNASLEDIQEITEELLKIENSSNLQEKIKLCEEYLNSSSKLLQFVTLQYILEKSLWENNLVENITHINIIKKFITNAIVLVESNEPSIRGEALNMLKYASRSVYIPIFVKKINDENLGIRNIVKNVLNVFAHDQKILDYNPDTSVENLNIIQEKWQRWWEDNKESFDKKNN